MIFDLQMLDQKAELNCFKQVGYSSFKNGVPLTLNMRLFNPETNLRHVPSDSATFAMDFKLSDGSVVSKVPTFIDDGDRSLITVSLDASETALLIGQDLEVTIVDGAMTCIAIARMAIKSAKSSC